MAFLLGKCFQANGEQFVKFANLMDNRNIESVGGGNHKLKIKKEKLKIFEEIISLENLLLAWKEFKRGKRSKKDVQEFEFNLEDNLFQLHRELKGKIYQHSNYTSFYVSDPKPRKIHKAIVRDRVLHHAIFRILYPILDKGFIFDSYSCRLNKGTHRAVARLEKFCRKLSRNNTRNIFAVKCDIKRFFDSVDQEILLNLIRRKVKDEDAVWLVKSVIRSFSLFTPTPSQSPPRAGGEDLCSGLPLGNVTSQLFANIYLNELDQFVKHRLKIKYYLRYCDDFVVLSDNVKYLQELIPRINNFLKFGLKLTFHPNKIIFRKYRQGIDFLGYVVLPHRRVLRTKTKRRMLRKIRIKHLDLQRGIISEKSFNQTLQSYFGVLKHCRSHKIIKRVVFCLGNMI